MHIFFYISSTLPLSFDDSYILQEYNNFFLVINCRTTDIKVTTTDSFSNTCEMEHTHTDFYHPELGELLNLETSGKISDMI